MTSICYTCSSNSMKYCFLVLAYTVKALLVFINKVYENIKITDIFCKKLYKILHRSIFLADCRLLLDNKRKKCSFKPYAQSKC